LLLFIRRQRRCRELDQPIHFSMSCRASAACLGRGRHPLTPPSPTCSISSTGTIARAPTHTARSAHDAAAAKFAVIECYSSFPAGWRRLLLLAAPAAAATGAGC
jgi:hypothetical protein